MLTRGLAGSKILFDFWQVKAGNPVQNLHHGLVAKGGYGIRVPCAQERLEQKQNTRVD
jgi:hypothetical protein